MRGDERKRRSGISRIYIERDRQRIVEIIQDTAPNPKRFERGRWEKKLMRRGGWVAHKEAEVAERKRYSLGGIKAHLTETRGKLQAL